MVNASATAGARKMHIDHQKGHDNCKYEVFKLIFRHKKHSFRCCEDVLFVITRRSVRFQLYRMKVELGYDTMLWFRVQISF